MNETEIIDVNKYTYIDPKTNHRVEAERDTNVWSFEEYDERGNVPHMWAVSSDGIPLWDVWGTFDSHDNTIYTHETTWKSGSIEELDTWFDYDESGNEIHSIDSNGYETWTEYDEFGRVIHNRQSNGYETWTEYDYDGSSRMRIRERNGQERLTEWRNRNTK